MTDSYPRYSHASIHAIRTLLCHHPYRLRGSHTRIVPQSRCRALTHEHRHTIRLCARMCWRSRPQSDAGQASSKFQRPYLNGKWIIPTLTLIAIINVLDHAPEHFSTIVSKEGFPMLLFWITVILVAVLSFIKNFSLLPVLGSPSCFYLMAQESHTNWLRFIIWLVLGLVVYFLYSYSHSRLGERDRA